MYVAILYKLHVHQFNLNLYSYNVKNQDDNDDSGETHFFMA